MSVHLIQLVMLIMPGAWTASAISIVPAVMGQDEALRSRTVARDPLTGEWVDAAPADAGTPEGDLRLARQAVARREYSRGLRLVGAWERTYGKEHELYPAVVLVRTQAMIGQRRFEAARKILTRFIDEYDGTSYVHEALRQQFIIAEAFLGGVKRPFLWLPILPGEDMGLRILDDLSTGFTEDKHAEVAIKTKGDYFYRTGQHPLAELEYTRLLDEYPNGRYHAYALRRAADAAQASYAGVEYDEAPLIEAQQRYEEYALRYPSEAAAGGVGGILEKIRQDRADKVLSFARYYERTRHPRTAVYYYDIVLKEWPNTVAAEKARERLTILKAPPKGDSATQAPPARMEGTETKPEGTR